MSALHNAYLQHKKNGGFKEFVLSVLEFYGELTPVESSFFNKLFAEDKPSRQLEKILHSRVHIDDNVLTKNFRNVLTNSLLFVDVLAYRQFLFQQILVKPYVQRLEYVVINFIYYTLNSKSQKTAYDEQLIRLFEASASYSQKRRKRLEAPLKELAFTNYTIQEKNYLLDLVCLSAWDDKVLENEESNFIVGLGTQMYLEENLIMESIDSVAIFFSKYQERVSLFKSDNPVKLFYDNSSQLVKKLITRNKKRLLKEFTQSKELLVLLTKSTTTDLTPSERKKVKDQLLEIFKTIPSLAIFALPGGGILLPLFIKLIPKMLPSAFDDNHVEEEQEF